jgi:hypothetical protein
VGETLAQMVLPEFAHMPALEQAAVVEHVLRNWPTLKQNEVGLVSRRRATDRTFIAHFSLFSCSVFYL